MIEPSVQVPERLLLGSGPSPVPATVLRALAQPTIGHLDPAFGQLMDGVTERLREVFVTENRATLAVSGTGSAGMQTMVANFLAPGQRAVVGIAGLFGERMADAMSRRGVVVERVEAEWGRAIEPERLAAAMTDDTAALFVVHGETSTGVVQPLQGLAEACRAVDALFMIDCVTSLAGVPLALDEAGVDVAFSGTQKCLNCPPGLAPFTFSDRARRRLESTSKPSPSWYFDLRAILAYWRDDGEGAAPRAYHHTAPINMLYGLSAALALVLQEGLSERWERHERAHEALRSALAHLGFERLAPEGEALASLLAVRLPHGIDDAGVRRALLFDHGIEISSGVGPLAGRVWRIGVMGEGARLAPQRRLVSALTELLHVDSATRTGALTALEDGWSA